MMGTIKTLHKVASIAKKAVLGFTLCALSIAGTAALKGVKASAATPMNPIPAQTVGFADPSKEAIEISSPETRVTRGTTPLAADDTVSAAKYGENGVAITYSGNENNIWIDSGDVATPPGSYFALSFKLKIEKAKGNSDANFRAQIGVNGGWALYRMQKVAGTTMNGDLLYSFFTGDLIHYSAHFSQEVEVRYFLVGGHGGSFRLRPISVDNKGGGTIYISDLKLQPLIGAPKEVSKGSAVGELPAIPEKPGYTGVWKMGSTTLNRDAKPVYGKAESITEKTVYNSDWEETAYAEYTPIQYSLVCKDVNGNTVGEPIPYTVETAKDSITLPAVPEVAHRENGRWADFDPATAIPATGTEYVLNAEYDWTQYTLTFKNGTATVGEPISYTANMTKDSIVPPAIPAVAGKTGVWQGWKEFEPANGENKEFTLVYTPIQYSLVCKDVDGKTVGEPIPYTVETAKDSITLPAVPEVAHRENGRWADFDPATAIPATGTEYVLNAEYDWTQYTLTFKNSTATVGEPISYTVNTAKDGIIPPTIPAVAGKTGVWQGWEEFEPANGENKEFVLVYTAIQYTLQFEGVAGKTLTYTVDSDADELKAQFPAVPEVAHKTNGRWVAFDPATAIPQTGTTFMLQAEYDVEQVTVTFTDDQNQIVGTAVTLDYGGKVAAKDIPAVPEKTGYTGKWMIGETEFTAETVIEGDTTVKAVYTALTDSSSDSTGSSTTSSEAISSGCGSVLASMAAIGGVLAVACALFAKKKES